MFAAVLQVKKSTLLLFAKVTVVLLVLASVLLFFSDTISSWTTRNRDIFTPHKPIAGTNVGAIIEDRPLSNLAPLLLHFSSVLGPNWPIVLFTNPSTNPLLDASAPFQRAVEEGRIEIRALPKDTSFKNHAAVSELLTAPWFWEQLAPAGHVLLFQADSILCSNSKTKMESFLEYDFVGAPIDVPLEGNAGHGEGYNGGLSLRNRTMILDIIKKYSCMGEKAEGKIVQDACVTKAPCLKFEDQWYYSKMKGMGARLPSKEVAATFAVETIWYDTPLGYHQVDRWNADNIDKVVEWCPEYKIATTDGIVWHGKKEGT